MRHFTFRVTAGCWLALMTLAVAQFLVFRQHSSLAAYQRSTAAIEGIIGAVDATVSFMHEAEAAQRAYLVTGDERYLESYEEARGKSVGQLRLLRTLTADNPAHQARLDEIEPLVQTKLARLDKDVRARRQRGTDPATAAALDVDGGDGTARIKATLTDMKGEETGRLAGTVGAAESSRRRGLTLFTVFTLLDALLLLVCFGLLQGYVNYRDRTQAEVQRSKEAAEAASRAKDRFLAVLSHELRTPLTPVLLTVSLLESNAQLPDEIRTDLKVVHNNVEMEARLIDDLLDLTRITSGKLQLRPQTVDAHLLLSGAVDICRRDDRPADRCDLLATDHHVLADPGRLQQVFWNLLNNAHKFTPADGTVSVRSYNAPDGRLVVEVADSGIGIDPEILPKLFDAFEQGDPQTGRQFGGLGLGLTICKALVEAQGGTLTAHSAGRGQGATFTVALPTVSTSVPADEPADTSGDAIKARPAKAGLRVLVVEDHAPTRKAMARLLSGLGHQAVCAGSVAEALDAAQRDTLDLIISDLNLPDGTGHELMRSVSRSTPVKGIALSGYGMEEDVRASLDAGFTEHLTKPIDISALKAALTRIR